MNSRWRFEQPMQGYIPFIGGMFNDYDSLTWDAPRSEGFTWKAMAFSKLWVYRTPFQHGLYPAFCRNLERVDITNIQEFTHIYIIYIYYILYIYIIYICIIQICIMIINERGRFCYNMGFGYPIFDPKRYQQGCPCWSSLGTKRIQKVLKTRLVEHLYLAGKFILTFSCA